MRAVCPQSNRPTGNGIRFQTCRCGQRFALASFVLVNSVRSFPFHRTPWV